MVNDSDSEDDLDHLEIRLNVFYAREKKALENWTKLKFRLILVSKFSSLRNFDANAAVESVSTDDAEEVVLVSEKRKWYIIDHESKNK